MSLYNALFGRNPASALLLAMLDLTPDDVGRFRDCYLSESISNSKDLLIVIYTRNGGGNRDDYETVTEKLQAHPSYVSDADDDFDCTYASYFFNVPEKFKAEAQELALMGAKSDISPQDRFLNLIKKMQARDQTDPEVQRATAIGNQIFSKIQESMDAQKGEGNAKG